MISSCWPCLCIGCIGVWTMVSCSLQFEPFLWARGVFSIFIADLCFTNPFQFSWASDNGGHMPAKRRDEKSAPHSFINRRHRMNPTMQRNIEIKFCWRIICKCIESNGANSTKERTNIKREAEKHKNGERVNEMKNTVSANCMQQLKRIPLSEQKYNCNSLAIRYNNSECGRNGFQLYFALHAARRCWAAAAAAAAQQ